MAIARSDLAEMERDQLVDIILDMDRRLEDLEERVKEDFATASKDRSDIRADMNALEDALQADITTEVSRVGRKQSTILRRVANIEDELGFKDEDVLALAEGGQGAVRESDLAKLLDAGPQAVTKRPTAVYDRAEVLARNWIRWGQSTEKNGEIDKRTLATKRDDLKTRLEDATDESLSWKQVYRAMQKVADLGPENLMLTETRQGKMLVQRVDGGDSR